MSAEDVYGASARAEPPAVDSTKLSSQEEAAYQAWKATLPERLRYEGDYDLRGFYRKNPAFSVDKPGEHMTDEFKLPNHPTFSNESRYYDDATKMFGGRWMDQPGGAFSFIPNDVANKPRIDETKDGDPAPAGPQFGMRDLVAAMALAGKAR